MVTNQQILAQLGIINKKLDVLMSQSDDIAADTVLLTDEISVLNTSFDQLTALVEQLKANQGQPVDPAVLAAFDTALSALKPSVDKIASIAAPPAG